MPPSRIILAGYAGQSAAHLYHIAVSLGATVVDVRLHPSSRVPEWRKYDLRHLMGGYYDWITEWGNANAFGEFQTTAERRKAIHIANFEMGLVKMERMSGPVILLCGCKDPYTCHRFTLAKKLEALGYKYEHLRCSAFPLPKAPALF